MRGNDYFAHVRTNRADPDRSKQVELISSVGLSQPAVTARIQALEAAGVIEAYAARINPSALGMEITAIIRLRTTHEKIAECLKTFEQIPEILEANRITGEDCFIVKTSFYRMPRLEEVIDCLVRFGSVITSLVLASYPSKPFVEPR